MEYIHSQTYMTVEIGENGHMDISILTGNLQQSIQWVQTNPLIVTLMSGGAVVWLFSNLRNIWHKIISAVNAIISFNIYNTYEDNRGQFADNMLKIRQIIFNNFLTDSKTLWERTVNLDLNENSNIYSNDSKNAIEESLSSKEQTSNEYYKAREKSLMATYGFSIKLIFGKICFIDRSYKQDGMKIIVNTNVKVFFARKKKFIEKLEKYIRKTQLEMYQAMNRSEHVLVHNDATYSGLKMKRKLDTIFTDDNVHIELYKDIKKFLDNRELYKKLNYPYNYCALLHGVPGSGKSSTLLALATELGRSIVYINLASLSTTKLLKQLNSESDDRIFVFEDIDAITTKSTSKRSKDDRTTKELIGDDMLLKTLSLSDLLNITDGLLASDGTICLFTTNHIEKLDQAFLRAGRMNKIIEYKYMSASTANRMIKTYLGYEIAGLKDDIRPAELQEMILNIMTGKKTIEDLKKSFCI